MGAFFTNFHVRNASTQTVCAALPKLTDSRAYVSPPDNGWVTVYTEATEDQDDRKLHPILSGLSQTLKTDIVAFMVHDSDIALYWLYRGGELVDEFNSSPDYFGERISDADRARVRGKVDALLPLCIDDTMPEQLDEILHPPDGPASFAEDVIIELAKLLGIDETRATLGFNYFDEEDAEALPDAHDFEPVGKGTERKEPASDDDDEAVEYVPRRHPHEQFTTTFQVPDMYPLAVGMLVQVWSDKHAQTAAMFSKMLGQGSETMLKELLQGFDRQARDLLKKSRLPDLPTIEELKAARNAGPDALAELVAKKTPDQLTEIGIGAAIQGVETFVAALLKQGLDPTAPGLNGRTTLSAAEQHGADSPVYRLVKAAVDKKGE